ncbi:MAG: ABC transporter substrate-binding protein [bacterium]|nr:ABC transporter substrate-binding protein [bacterium]
MYKRLLGVLIALSVLVTACGGDSDSDTTDDAPVEQPTTAPTAPEPDDEEPATAPEPDDEEPATAPEPDDEESEPAEPEATPVPLTASFRGVTPTEIRIGITSLNAEMFMFDQGDLAAKWQVAVDAVNAKGGIHGRMLVPFIEVFDVILASAEAEAACVRFVEDEMVFAFVGWLREDHELCYTELNNTIAVNANDVSEEAIRRSNGMLFATEATTLGIELNMIAAAAADGVLDGKSIHVTVLATGESMLDPMVAALEAGGATISSTTIATEVSDVPSAEAEHDIIVQRIADDGPDLVYAPQTPELMAAALQRAGIEVAMISSEASGEEYLNFGVDPGAIQLHVYAQPPLKYIYEQGDPLLEECVDNYNNAQITDEDGNVELVNVTEDPDLPGNFSLLVRACQAVQLFTLIATAAGPNLTNETFLAAAANLGSIDMPGMTAASVYEGKTGVDDSPLVKAIWDPDEEEFVLAP